MQKKRRPPNGEEGFTLIEMIAVLIVLGILVAVAIPRYMSVMDDARERSAKQAIAEAQARLSNGHAIAMLATNGGNVTMAQIIGNTNVNSDSFGEYNITVTDSGNFATITVIELQGVPLASNAVGYWNLPVRN